MGSTIFIYDDNDEKKSISNYIETYFPLYSLFSADKKNTDFDYEIQNSMQLAIQQIIASPDIQEKLIDITKQVSIKIQDVANLTNKKLSNINPNLTKYLTTGITKTNSLAWCDVFKKVSIWSDDLIPINKRGSGVKRLILLSFFQAEAEKMRYNSNRTVIYAIEEPEISQHYEYKMHLIEALKKLGSVLNRVGNLMKTVDFGTLREVRNICLGVETASKSCLTEKIRR